MINVKVIGIGALILILVLAGFFLILGGRTGIGGKSSIDISFKRPDGKIFAGQPFTLGISFSNESGKFLNNVVLSIALPEDVSLLGGDGIERNIEDTVGDLSAGSIGQRNFDLIVLGKGKTIKTIKTKIAYSLEGSKARFAQEASIDIPIEQPAVSLSFDIPQNIFSGEDFDLVIKYRNATDEEMKNVKLQIDYPSAFQFQKAEPAPKASPRDWELKTLGPQEEGKVVITGKLVGPEQTFFGFTAKLLSEYFGTEYTVNTQSANVSIAASPLSISITANGTPNYVSQINDSINYTISFRNNSNVTFENLKVRAKLIGELFDFKTIQSDGSFDSLTNTVTWIPANVLTLSSLAPGEENSVSVNVSLIPEFPIRRLSDKNYVLKIEAEVESLTVPQETRAERTFSVARLETKVRGAIDVDAQGYFRDAASGILNNGPYPPRVNQPTEYTIHWVIRNFATDMTNIRVHAFLKSNTRWTGKVKSNIGTIPQYNAARGEVVWDIPFLPATKGIASPPAEAVFQVENTPAINQIGGDVILLSDTLLEATDAFVNLPTATADSQITTALPDDQTVRDLPRGVQQ